VIYEGNRYPLVERPTFGELEWVERQAKTDFGAMSGMAKNRGYVLLALRRAGIMLTWADTADLSPADIVSDPEDAADDGGPVEDPTQPGSGGSAVDPAA